MERLKSYIKNIYTKEGMKIKLIKKYYYIVLIIIMTILLINSIQIEYGNPKNSNYVNYYLKNGVRDTGAINLVASIYLDYRSYDTLMETIVLFMAVMGVTFFLRKDK